MAALSDNPLKATIFHLQSRSNSTITLYREDGSYLDPTEHAGRRHSALCTFGSWMWFSHEKCVLLYSTSDRWGMKEKKREWSGKSEHRTGFYMLESFEKHWAASPTPNWLCCCRTRVICSFEALCLLCCTLLFSGVIYLACNISMLAALL